MSVYLTIDIGLGVVFLGALGVRTWVVPAQIEGVSSFVWIAVSYGIG